MIQFNWSFDRSFWVSYQFNNLIWPFDRVNHRGILYKLCSVGIGCSVLYVLTHFLSNRSQHVMVDSCRSKLHWKQGLFRLTKKASTIQYDNRIWVTPARFFQNTAHGNSKNEIRQWNRRVSLPNQNTISINIIWYYFIRDGKIVMKFN